MRGLRDAPAFEVLVADDDPDIRELLAEFFRGRGLPCATAHDGRAATKALEQSDGRFGLVLTDIAMPGADGFAVLAAARIANPETYVVMITGFAALDTAIQAVRSGAQDYLTKPFALGQLDVILGRATARLGSHGNGAAAAAALENRLIELETRLVGIESSLDRILELLHHETRAV
jgi:DNA-binding NtrC family response regulator